MTLTKKPTKKNSKKQTPKKPNGRPKGSRDKKNLAVEALDKAKETLLNGTNPSAKAALIRAIEDNTFKIQDWIVAIEKKDGPQAAFNCYLKLLDYHFPKLSRQEVKSEITGKDGSDLNWTIRLVQVDKTVEIPSEDE